MKVVRDIKVDIDYKIENLRKELDSLLKEKEQMFVWEPKGGEWYIEAAGNISRCFSTGDSRDFGVEFYTEDAAILGEKAYRRYHRLYKLAEELNEGSVSNRYIVNADREGKNFSICLYVDYLPYGGIGFKTRELAEKAVHIIKQEL